MITAAWSLRQVSAKDCRGHRQPVQSKIPPDPVSWMCRKRSGGMAKYGFTVFTENLVAEGLIYAKSLLI
jgi:hypothetical protein